MRERSKRARGVHFLIVTILWACFIPVVLMWKKEIPKTNLLKETGIVLIDRSASVKDKAELEKIINERSEDYEIITCGFSKGLTNPHGSHSENKGTDLGASLKELLPIIDDRLPEWVWVVSDGGYEQMPKIPESIQSLKRYISQIPSDEENNDYGLQDLRTDPVWYTRTETNLSVKVFRNFSDSDSRIDVLLLIDGEINNTQKVYFEEGQKEVLVEFTAKALNLGPRFIEVKIAEGQGGGLLQNDHLVEKVQVLRDKLRVLRVVGRPTWSSKFLRSYLMAREDIDLIDFHILRGMNDRVLASNADLALIPFPVEELFVQNIESFDLIIWQNFDNQSYPFFRHLYLQNIKKYVNKGGGLLLWSGKLRWDFTKGIFADLSPLNNRGTNYVAAKAHIQNTKDQHLLPDDLVKRIDALPKMELNVFPGSLHPDSHAILDFEDKALLAVRHCGKGRVLQINSDSLWDLNFSLDQKGLYESIVKASIMWLQKHPDLNLNSYAFENQNYVDATTEVLFNSELDKNLQLKLTKDKNVISKIDLQKGFKKFKVPLPSIPGVYKMQIGKQQNSLIALKYIENEFKQQSTKRENIDYLVNNGFEELKLGREYPSLNNNEEVSSTLKTDEPFHVSWLYLALVCGCIFSHWVIISRSPIHYT